MHTTAFIVLGTCELEAAAAAAAERAVAEAEEEEEEEAASVATAAAAAANNDETIFRGMMNQSTPFYTRAHNKHTLTQKAARNKRNTESE